MHIHHHVNSYWKALLLPMLTETTAFFYVSSHRLLKGNSSRAKCGNILSILWHWWFRARCFCYGCDSGSKTSIFKCLPGYAALTDSNLLTFWDSLQVQSSRIKIWELTGCPKMSVTNYLWALCNTSANNNPKQANPAYLSTFKQNNYKAILVNKKCWHTTALQQQIHLTSSNTSSRHSCGQSSQEFKRQLCQLSSITHLQKIYTEKESCLFHLNSPRSINANFYSSPFCFFEQCAGTEQYSRNRMIILNVQLRNSIHQGGLLNI